MRNSECAMRNDALWASNGVANSCEAIHDRVNSCRRQFILARPEREGGIRRMTGGFIFLTYISNLPFTRDALMPRGTSFGSVEHQRKQNALFLVARTNIFAIRYYPPYNARLRSDQVESYLYRQSFDKIFTADN